VQRKFLIILISILGFSLSSRAQSNLMIMPIRVVFEGNKQKEELNLANIGKDTAVYAISLVQKNMTEDGSFVNIQKIDSSQMSAEPYLRIFPRRVKLAPGETQVISLQFRRKPDMAAGEYRSHLYFRPDKNYTPHGIENNDNDPTSMSFQITPLFGISIAVIIRIGEGNVSASLSDLKLENRENAIQNLKLTINRTGNISLYGDVIIQYFPVQGKSYQIGTAGGVGVYSNINKRFVTVKLNNTSGKPLKDGKLKVQYVSKDEDKKSVVYAEGVLDIRE